VVDDGPSGLVRGSTFAEVAEKSSSDEAGVSGAGTGAGYSAVNASQGLGDSISSKYMCKTQAGLCRD
jgi:hypothetical protein